ncbi:MAG: 3-dehydroquinate synthase [Candidatus Micrarchaeia archaeon]
MRTLNLRTGTGESRILIGESIANLHDYADIGKAVIITDATVKKLHGGKFPKAPVIEIGLGEGNKTLDTVQKIYRRFAELEIERGSTVIGIGGGIVTDVAGFAASTYMRGVDFGFVPTTLVAQADAAIGGKNGVNLDGYKNLVGTIRQPRFVICDFELLRTLPKREMSCGFSEIIKHAAIADAQFFAYLEENVQNAMGFKKTAIEKAVHDALAVKAGIVSEDESEKGGRMKLNFGHTVGHAIEKCVGLPHGEAVSIGMMVAAGISQKRGILAQKDVERLEAVLKQAGLPTSMPKGKAGAAQLLDAVKRDKKRKSGSIMMSLLSGIGKAQVSEVGINELEGILNDIC